MVERDFQNYFVWNGIKYYTGTVIVVNDMGRQVEASFVCYDKTYNWYIYKIKECRYSVWPKQFEQALIEVTDRVDKKVHMPMVKTLKDSQIDGLFLGWIWYIFLMAIATIFKGNIGLWIIISIAFFNWRNNKIKEEGTYIEW